MQELLYLDPDGLERLFAQTSATTPTRLTEEITGERSTSGKIAPEGRFSFLGLSIGGGVEKGAAGKRAARLTRETEVRPENQLAVIRAALESHGRLHHELYSAQNEARSTGGSAFCDVQGLFRPFGWQEQEDGWRRRANREGSLLLELVDDPLTRVGMRLSKLVFGVDQDEIRPSGHLAQRLRNPAGLRILGTVDAGRYIKPYAAAFL